MKEVNIEENTFAAACYEQNTLEDLEQSLRGDPDMYDCRVWRITPEQWRSEIELAITKLRQDAADSENPAHVFRGSDAGQNDHDGLPAIARGWYWQPADYEGDVLWSRPFDSEVEATEDAENSGFDVKGVEDRRDERGYGRGFER